MGDSNPLASNPNQDGQLLSSALEAFNANNFEQCIEHLGQVSASMAVDPKVVHNVAVAQFYASHRREYDAFQASIDALLPAVKQQPTAACTDDTDGSALVIDDTALLYVHFNRAVVLFHLRQPKAALRILSALMVHLADMDDTLAQRSGLLTIHLLLNGYQVRRATALIEQLEARLSTTAPELLPGDGDEDLDLEDTGARVTTTTSAAGAGTGTDQTDRFRWMFRLYKLRCNVMAGRNVTIANEETSELSVLRAHQFYNGIDYQMAAKELSKKFVNASATIELNGEDHNTVIANNMGIIHFHVRHYAMSVRFFQHALTFDQSAAASAADASAPAAAGGGTDKPLPVQCVGATKRPEILYNLGVAMLHMQRPREAFECLLVPLTYYHSNPRIWLRLAEACIMVHSQAAKERECKTLVSSVIGAGMHRKYVLQPTPMKYVSDQSQSFAIPSTNLEFASLCLRNAWTLVDFHANEFKARAAAAAAAAAATATATTTASATAADAAPAAGGTASSSTAPVRTAVPSQPTAPVADEKPECSPSKPLIAQSMHNLRCAVLAASAYVQICLGEYLLALDYARKLAQLEQLPDVYAMLAHLYCAEALIMLDRVPDARKYLEPKFIKELKEDDFIQRGTPDWPINTVDGAHAILTYNLAVTFLLQGEYEVARSVLTQCQHHPLVGRHVKAALLYVELQAGNVAHCKMMIGQDTPQHV